MKFTHVLASAVVTAVLAGSACADPIIVTSTVASQQVGPTTFDYKITLSNSALSTDSLKTFWYAWVPGKDFLLTSPLSVVSPTGWTGVITHVPNVPTNGYAIQWVTTANALAPGSSAVFEFTSTDTPDQVFGISAFYPGVPVGTSFVYSGAPFQGDSLQFTVTPVPEPASFALTAAGALSLAAVCARGRLRKAAAEAVC